MFWVLNSNSDFSIKFKIKFFNVNTFIILVTLMLQLSLIEFNLFSYDLKENNKTVLTLFLMIYFFKQVYANDLCKNFASCKLYVNLLLYVSCTYFRKITK